MILTSRIAKDLEKLITRTEFDPIDIKHKLDLYKEMKRITHEEYDYLVALVEEYTNKDIQEQLKAVK